MTPHAAVLLGCLAAGLLAVGCSPESPRSPQNLETPHAVTPESPESSEPQEPPDPGTPSETSRSLPLGSETQTAVELTAGEVHGFDVPLAPHGGVAVRVEQWGLDVMVELYDPSGRLVASVDSPVDGFGSEHLCHVRSGSSLAEESVSDPYELRIRAWDAGASGGYGIQAEIVREPTKALRACAEGTQALAAAEAARLDGVVGPDLEELYSRGLGAWRRSGRVFPQMVAVEWLGRLADYHGSLEDARRLFEEGLGLAEATEDVRRRATFSNLLGLVEHRLGLLEQAESRFMDAASMAEQLDDPRRQASAFNNRGLLAQTRGEHGRALELFQRSMDLSEEADEEATFLHNLGISYTSLGRFVEALEAFEASLGQRRASTPARVPETLIMVGWVHFLSGELERSKTLLEEALELCRAAGDGVREAWALDRLGSAYRELGRFPEALRAHRRFLVLSEAAGNRLDMAAARANLGWLFMAWERPEEARLELTRALELFDAIGDRAARAHVLVGLAQAERRLGRLDRALAWAERASEDVGTLRASGHQRGERFRALPLWQSYGDLHIDLLMQLHRQRPQAGYDIRAFEISDLERARGLYEILEESRIDLRSGVDPALLEEEQRLRHRLRALEVRLHGSNDGALATAVDRSRRRLDSVERAIRVASPRFAELRQPTLHSATTIQSLLDPDSLLLSFVLGDEGSILFQVDRERVIAHELPPRSTLEGLARAVWSGLQTVPRGHWQSQGEGTLERLAEHLLGPVAESLPDRRLIIVGDGILHYLPFAALPLPEPQAAQRVLIDRHEIVRLPSLSVLEVLRRRAADRRSPEGTLAVLADPSLERSGPLSELPLLPEARREAEQILGWVPDGEGTLLALGADAHAGLVRGGQLGEFRILHFATHSWIDEEHPGRSGLVLAAAPSASGPDDGLLRLTDIYACELPVDLVVLSACSTALGAHVRGAGLQGLTRGFFYAGATRLLVSLWDVDDEATADLMIRFYRNLLHERLPATAALRAAQLQVRQDERWEAPYFWAGFIIQGDWR